ncbi:peroxiredoxin [Aureococcus anophagefferens]|nr:peroxiredoxin [Aureococcus anophagefferens]
MGQKMSVKAGDTIPSVVLCDGMQFPPKLVNVADEIKGKKVMKAWAKDQSITGDGLITGDLGPARSKRFVLLVEDGVVKFVQLSEAPDDPAGDNDAASPVAAETMVEKILTLL